MAKLNAINTAAQDALTTSGSAIGTLNLYTLPLETFVVNFSKTAKEDKPKVILELAVPVEGVGTIQIFAPSYLRTYEEQFEYLAEYFEHGDTLVGANLQEALYFKRYEPTGPNYEIVTKASASKKMEVTGLNSNVMEFGAANTKLSRKEVETATALNRGNYGKVAASTKGGVESVLSSVFGAAKSLLS